LAQHCSLELTTHSTAETWELGAQLGRLLQPGHVVALIGELGAGKTCLTQGIATGLGVERNVTSATFIMVNEYLTARDDKLCHVDCYRFAADGAAQALGIGLDELLDGEAICVVEWADRIESLLPPDHLQVTLTYLDESTRRFCFVAFGDQHAALLADLKAQRLGSSETTFG
jgi:tRNA threonylcarbamoyladenosine biosynthesis protein TsaE